MSKAAQLNLPAVQIAEICRRHRVRELCVFGSVARGDVRPDSDIDLLVEFDPDAGVGLLRFAHLMNELTDLLGKKVDLVPKQGLKPLIRDAVLADARVIYAA
ncbi:MAG: nucleotidyltransferase family protein [Acidobacteria bacterium]|nr:nucleotidyltransferase family protein [Acidobacteriota bacterium]MBI3473516.1 nucleotidyltransferase family protein [Candidatus Solibacter usitatus]